MKMWIAKNEGDSFCFLFEDKPKKAFDKYTKLHYWVSYYGNGMVKLCDGLMLHPSKFPEVTFENSPMEVELKLIEK